MAAVRFCQTASLSRAGGLLLKYVLTLYETVIPEKLQFFFALSRTHHGVLDMMSPVFAALIYLGQFPDLDKVIVGLLTVFAGYTAIYALNDIAGFNDDKNSIKEKTDPDRGTDLDSILIRHPLAQGRISFRSAVLWSGFWGLTAFAGAWYLNPVCMLIFFTGALLEIIYCLMLKISYLRIIVSCFVKSAGPVAAVFAVDASPDLSFVFLIFLFHFLWEAGGQNIPNDYSDIEEDRVVKARTFPIRFGRDFSAITILCCLICSTITMGIIFVLSPADFGIVYYLFLVASSVYLLVLPAWELVEKKRKSQAMALFNRASYYPLFLVFIVLMKISI